LPAAGVPKARADWLCDRLRLEASAGKPAEIASLASRGRRGEPARSAAKIALVEQCERDLRIGSKRARAGALLDSPEAP
jgi:hypothetical protein